jgi:hypothetical protein
MRGPFPQVSVPSISTSIGSTAQAAVLGPAAARAALVEIPHPRVRRVECLWERGLGETEDRSERLGKA